MELSQEISNFIEEIKTRDHLILFYDTEERKRSVLFPYLKDGLLNNKGVIYICSDETPEQIREGLKTYVAIQPEEFTDKIKISTCEEWYIRDAGAEPLRVINKWKKAYQYFDERGLGLRVMGETSCFFRNDLVRELMRYEYALHRILNVPMDAICSYNLRTIVDTGYTDVIMPLIRAHGKALFLAHGGSIIIEPEHVEDTDIEKLLEIDIN
jgi:hypothetical protein